MQLLLVFKKLKGNFGSRQINCNGQIYCNGGVSCETANVAFSHKYCCDVCHNMQVLHIHHSTELAPCYTYQDFHMHNLLRLSGRISVMTNVPSARLIAQYPSVVCTRFTELS